MPGYRRVRKYMVFSRQEILHAINPGPVQGFLRELAESYEFRRATGNSITTEKMTDREFVLRFLAFHVGPWENYAANDLDRFLAEAMIK